MKSKYFFWMILVSACVLSGCFSKNPEESTESFTLGDDDRLYMQRYLGDRSCPDDLHQMYVALVDSFRSGDEKEIAAHCLPESIRFQHSLREGEYSQYGSQLNLPFAMTQFSPEVLSVNEVSDGLYQLRTPSSVLHIVETSDQGWKLYHYRDKPYQ